MAGNLPRPVRRLRWVTLAILLLGTALAGAWSAAPAARAAATTSGAPDPPSTYWLYSSGGGVFPFGAAPNAGSEAGQSLAKPVVGMAGVPGQAGYWLVASDGGIFSFGAARFYGSTGAIHLNKPIVGMAATPDGNGYWMVATDGGIFTFGDARFFGSTGNLNLARPIVGMAPTPDGGGYYLVASDGGIFTFGDAVFRGSTGAIHLNQPIVGMAVTPDNGGYWMVASDGGVFTFGDATFYGSMGGTPLNQPIVGMAAPAGGGGYWMVAADGGLFTFGSAVFHGSLGGTGGAQAYGAHIIGMATAQSLDPYTPGSTGYDISWPQCPNNVPPAATVSVVGVNSGAAFRHNDCLGTEATWGRQGGGLTLYANVNAPFVNDPSMGSSGPKGNCAPSDSLCQAYNYGYNDAVDAWSSAASAGVSAPMWWLDVEGPAGSDNALWTSDLGANDAVIGGAIDALTALGAQPGVYSTSYQWGLIAGSGYQPDVPVWIPGASDAANAATFCASSFTTGQVWLVQYGYGNGPASQWDPDYAC